MSRRSAAPVQQGRPARPAVVGMSRPADVPLLTRPDEKRHLDAVVSADPGHLGQFGRRQQHRAAARSMVDRDTVGCASATTAASTARSSPGHPHRQPGNCSAPVIRADAPQPGLGQKSWRARMPALSIGGLRRRSARFRWSICWSSSLRDQCQPPVQRGAATAGRRRVRRPARRAGHRDKLAPVGDEVGIFRLRAARQARIPGDRVTSRDGLAVPARASLIRRDLELALGEADRAALVVTSPLPRRAVGGIGRVQSGQSLAVGRTRPGG